ncbi:hypothetical protein RI367_007573 [Sorochytrium milnesiophthora]
MVTPAGAGENLDSVDTMQAALTTAPHEDVELELKAGVMLNSPVIDYNLPMDFGYMKGTTISNKDTILADIDRCLCVNRPPDVEYLFFEPCISYKLQNQLRFLKLHNPYGHCAIRYTLPSGEQKVVNASRLKRIPMISVFDPAEYLFGLDEFFCNEQLGIYNRHIVGLRIEHVTPEKILEMDAYFTDLQLRAREDRAKFTLAPVSFLNILRQAVPCLKDHIAERGNCAAWVSRGLVKAGLIKHHRNWPKRIWIELFENCPLRILPASDQEHQPTNNMHVVAYRRIEHCLHRYAKETGDKLALAGVTALSPLKSATYYHLTRFADLVVSVPPGTRTAIITRPPKQPKEPSRWRYHRVKFILFAMLFITAVVLAIVLPLTLLHTHKK